MISSLLVSVLLHLHTPTAPEAAALSLFEQGNIVGGLEMLGVPPHVILGLSWPSTFSLTCNHPDITRLISWLNQNDL
jgi:hypothetical protein